MNYYEALTVKPVTSLDISNYNSLNKYLILHRDVAIWHLSGIMVNYEGLEGNLSNVPFERAAYQISIASQWYRYKRRNKSDVLDQIHLYLKDSIVPVFDSNGHIKITLMDIKKAEVYQKDRLRTSVSWGIPSVLTVFPALLVLALLFPQ
jgi:hypothetical protein